MTGFVRHPLFLSVLAAVILYVIFAYGIQPPVPKSLLIQYMIFSVIGILMVATFHDSTAKRMAEPIAALFGDPRLKVPHAVVFVILVGAAGGLAYTQVKPDLGAPTELRTVHPAPPSSIRVYGKSYNLLALGNPLRAETAGDPERFQELVAEGGELYYKNCVFCHGDLLDGKGHLAAAFNPRPANFQDVGTIAQLQESYLFWRITTGAPGLPREGAPWASAMPVWHEMLSEDEVWKIILFLYDYTGYEPRSWELAESGGEDGPTSQQEAPAGGDAGLDEEAVEAIYLRRCAQCHGDEGDGLGPAADYMYPKPRDFTLALFKYKTTHADDEFPTDEDLRRTIRNGLPGTAMPGWKTTLNDAEIDGLINWIKVFGGWDEEEIEHAPIEEGNRVASSPESLERGKALFKKACVQCHGADGRGNVTSGKKLKDDWGDRIWPRNLTRPETWRVTEEALDVFQRISTGIRGTPMPEHTTTMPEADRWDVANYVMTLRDRAVPFATGESVVRGARTEGELPTDPDDPAWQTAQPITFRLTPNIVKEPRLFFSLNDAVTVRVLFNAEDIAIRLDVDDRTYSVPGDELEKAYRVKDIEPTRDAVAVQFPVDIPLTSEKPWFRHGDPRHPVNMWYWAAPSADSQGPEQAVVLDAAGPGQAPRPRSGDASLQAKGAWRDGRWQVVMRYPLRSGDALDLQFQAGRYIPVAFANWDGVAGERGSRHSLTSWYWLLLEPEDNPAMVYGVSAGAGFAVALLLAGATRQQRRRFRRGEPN